MVSLTRRSEAIDDDVQLAVLADMIANLSERVAARGRRRAAQRDARHHLEFLSRRDPPRGQHGVGRGELDVHGESGREPLHRERRARLLRIARRHEQRCVRRDFRRQLR
jgi:hypothetical protein